MLKPNELLPEEPMGGIYYDLIFTSRYEVIKNENDLLFFALPATDEKLEDCIPYGAFCDFPRGSIGEMDNEFRLRLLDLLAHNHKNFWSGYLLLDLITLFEKIDELCEWKFLKQDSYDIASKAITDLCEEYGLLIRELNLQLPPEIVADRRIEYFGFSLSVFATEMKNLYRLYLLWLIKIRGMINGELVAKYKRLLPNVQNNEALIASNDLDGAIGFESACNTVKPSMILNPFDENHRIMLVAGSPIFAAKLEMLKLFSIDASQYGTVSECCRCGKDFISHHANRKLCEDCRTNAAKLRAFRAREKGKKKEGVEQH